MNDIVPHFFFSYSRGTRRKREDPYLKRFVNDLREQVSELVNVDADKVGFRDVDNLKEGDDWKAGISLNARRSHALICLYSTRFFDQNRHHEYCGKELAVFLKRCNAQYCRDNGGEAQFRSFRNIFPVLWIGETDLGAAKLPPYAVRAIQYTSEDDEYRANGLKWMLKKKRTAYHDIILKLGRLIRDSTKPPLPPLEEEIDIERMYNAFWEAPEVAPPEEAKPAAEPAEGVAAALPSGPMQMLAFEIRLFSRGARVWIPYKDQPNFETLVSDFASSPESKFELKIQTADPTEEGFADDVSKALATATGKQIIPILFVHPEYLGDEASRNALKKILENRWRGGLVVPADESDAQALSLVHEHWPELEEAQNKEEPPVMRVANGGAAKFQTTAASVAYAVLVLIQKHGVVQQIYPNSEGFSTIPRVANTLDAVRGQ
jgi:hypothetical protein